MLKYKSQLKNKARCLRSNMTNAESLLWSKLRRKQISGVQFYRQKPLGPYIVDFYAPSVKLVFEVDGSQHLEKTHAKKDLERDKFLNKLNLDVFRFNNLEVLNETESVLVKIHTAVEAKLEIPPNPPLQRGELDTAIIQAVQVTNQTPPSLPLQRGRLNTANIQTEQSTNQTPSCPLLQRGELGPAKQLTDQHSKDIDHELV